MNVKTVLMLFVLLLLIACSPDLEEQENNVMVDDEESEASSPGGSSSSGGSDSYNEDVSIGEVEGYYTGWVLYEKGDYYKNGLTEVTSDYSTLYSVQLKAIRMAPDETWLYVESMQVFDRGFEESKSEDACAEGQSTVNMEVEYLGEQSLTFTNPEENFEHAYFGYILHNEDGTKNYHFTILPDSSQKGKKTVRPYTTIYISSDEQTLYDSLPDDGAEYSCLNGADVVDTLEYTIGSTTIGSTSDDCGALDYKDDVLQEANDCTYETDGKSLFGEFFDAKDTSSGSIEDVAWVSVSWSILSEGEVHSLEGLDVESTNLDGQDFTTWLENI